MDPDDLKYLIDFHDRDDGLSDTVSYLEGQLNAIKNCPKYHDKDPETGFITLSNEAIDKTHSLIQVYNKVRELKELVSKVIDDEQPQPEPRGKLRTPMGHMPTTSYYTGKKKGSGI